MPSTVTRRSSSALATALLLAWSAALALAALVVILERTPRDPIEVTIAPERLEVELPGAFAARLDPALPFWLRCFGDTLASGRTSDLELFEDGRPIGPGHAPHQEISELGGGRYSHWHRRLLLSSSDGSDPRTNGRVYTVRVSARPAAWIEVSALLLAILGFCIGGRLAARGDSTLGRMLPQGFFVATVVGLFIMWNAAIAALAPAWIGVQNDSESYLGSYSMRTIGYPLVLRSVAWVFGDLRPLALLQVNSIIASQVLLAFVVAHVLRVHARNADAASHRSGRPAYGVASLLLLFLGTSTRVFETSFTVMADGIYTALVCTVAACLGLATIRRSLWLSLVTGVVVAWTVLVRPVGLGLVPAMALPWWWHRREPTSKGRASAWRTGLTLVAPAAIAIALLLGAASLRNLAVHGFFGLSSMGSMSLAGHVAWMISPETVPSEPELAAHLQAQIAPVLAQRPELDWPIDYYLHTSDEYNILLYQILLPQVRLWAGAHMPEGGELNRENERLLKVLGTSPVLHRPGIYARHVAANIAGAVYWLGRGAALQPSIAATTTTGFECLTRLQERDRALFDRWLMPPAESASLDRNMFWERLRYPIDDRPRLYAGLAVASTLLGLVLLPWTGRRVDDHSGRLAMLAASPAARMLGALALLAWGTIVLISLSATVIFRYVDALDPLFTTSIFIAAVLLWRAVVHRPAPRAMDAPVPRAGA